MGAARGTTPLLTLTFTERDLNFTTADHVYVTVECNHKCVTKQDAELEIGEKTIGFMLSQKETLEFPDTANIRIQANWTQNGRRYASNVVNYSFGKQLLQEELP